MVDSNGMSEIKRSLSVVTTKDDDCPWPSNFDHRY